MESKCFICIKKPAGCFCQASVYKPLQVASSLPWLPWLPVVWLLGEDYRSGGTCSL